MVVDIDQTEDPFYRFIKKKGTKRFSFMLALIKRKKVVIEDGGFLREEDLSLLKKYVTAFNSHYGENWEFLFKRDDRGFYVLLGFITLYPELDVVEINEEGDVNYEHTVKELFVKYHLHRVDGKLSFSSFKVAKTRFQRKEFLNSSFYVLSHTPTYSRDQVESVYFADGCHGEFAISIGHVALGAAEREIGFLLNFFMQVERYLRVESYEGSAYIRINELIVSDLPQYSKGHLPTTLLPEGEKFFRTMQIEEAPFDFYFDWENSRVRISKNKKFNDFLVDKALLLEEEIKNLLWYSFDETLFYSYTDLIERRKVSEVLLVPKKKLLYRGKEFFPFLEEATEEDLEGVIEPEKENLYINPYYLDHVEQQFIKRIEIFLSKKGLYKDYRVPENREKLLSLYRQSTVQEDSVSVLEDS